MCYAIMSFQFLILKQLIVLIRGVLPTLWGRVISWKFPEADAIFSIVLMFLRHKRKSLNLDLDLKFS